ncbi:MAG TPA: phage holin family protein [Opitutaceae bacterium]|nr:phage holin family protein [Opitutaceae bacterium]
MLEALFRLLGVDFNRKLAEVRGHIDELKRSAISQATEQVKETGITVGFILGGAIAALFTLIIALAALYVWVDMHQGPLVAFAVIGLVTALLAALMFALAFLRRKRGPAPAAVYRAPAASPPASPAAPLLMSVLPPPPANASFFDRLTHRFTSRVATAGDEALDAAVHAMRTSSRPALFGTLAVVALVGVLIGRRR